MNSQTCLLILCLNLFFVKSYSQNYIPEEFTEIVPTIPNREDVLIYIDPQQLNYIDQYKVISVLSSLSASNYAMDTLQVSANQNLYSIFERTYNIKIQDAFDYDFALQNVVKAVNSLNTDYLIYEGDNIIIPNLPTRPLNRSDADYVQLIDIYDNQKKVVLTDSLTFIGKEVLATNQSLEKSALWGYKLNQEDFKKFRELLSDKVFNELYGEAIVVIQEPSYTEVSFPVQNESVDSKATLKYPTRELLAKIKSIDPRYFSKYYILDFFNNEQCAHGDKVMDVIRARLNQYQLGNIDSNIISIPINYFDNEELAIQFLEKYYDVDIKKYPKFRLWKIKGDATIKALKSRVSRSLKKCSTCIPEAFLNASFKYYYNKKPDIISASFYVSTYDSDLMPKYFASSPTNIVAAALNEPGRKIEDLFTHEPGVDGLPTSSIEPLSALYLNYEESGGIIVGNKVSDGKYHGMYSQRGDRVSILGKGNGWISESGCIKYFDQGTSFATPDVGIALYIAKAYWRSKSLSLNPIQARKRLLMCVDIEPEFVGQFASAGVSNLNKLLTSSSGLVEYHNLDLRPAVIMKTSYIEFNKGRKANFTEDRDGIAGIAFIDQKAFAFFNSSIGWREIELDGINLKMVVDNKELMYTTVSAARDSYSQILFFN